jgi:hypothetical protein
MFAGDTKTIQVTVTDSTGADKDITGATITWALQQVYKTIIEKSTTLGGIAITDAIHGVFQILLLPIDTEGFSTGLYTHQAIVIDNNGTSEVVFTGTITINDSLF